MNLLNHFESLLNPKSTGVAIITGNKGNGVWVGQTIGGATVLLSSKDSYNTSQKVYYNRLTGVIAGIAPDMVFREFGV